MEDEKFDDVTRSLGEGSSRRRVVGGILGGVLGALGLGAAAREDADAAAKKVTVCKGGQTKKVSAKAWRRMQLSGADAYKGKCKTPTTTTTRAAQATTTTKAPKKHHTTTTKAPHHKKCGKEFDRCNKGDMPCCKHDPYSGDRLECKQGSKKGYNTCVAVGTTTTTTTRGTATTTTTGGTATTTTTGGTATTTTTSQQCRRGANVGCVGQQVCCSTTGAGADVGICLGNITACAAVGGTLIGGSGTGLGGACGTGAGAATCAGAGSGVVCCGIPRAGGVTAGICVANVAACATLGGDFIA